LLVKITLFFGEEDLHPDVSVYVVDGKSSCVGEHWFLPFLEEQPLAGLHLCFNFIEYHLDHVSSFAGPCRNDSMSFPFKVFGLFLIL
jgi:hypothetical protein